MKLPSMPQRGGSVETTVRDIINYIRATTVTSVNGGVLRETPNGTIINVQKPGVTSTSGATACPFGEIITIPDSDPPAKGIRGGVIYCGDQTWNMDPQSLNLTATGVWLVSIAVSVEVNRDDDNVIILPGIKTGTQPTGDWEKTAWTEGTNYPANTAPVAATGLGTIYVPLGKLTIAAGAAGFEPAGCGNITLGQCAGTLSHSRE
jgi:hypothetical protein